MKASVYTVIAVVINNLGSLGVNKLFAAWFGPQGIALLAHFQNLIALLTTVPNDGINRGIVKQLAGAGESRFSSTFYSSLIITCIVYFGSIAFIIGFHTFFLDEIGLQPFSLLFFLIVLGIFFLVLSLFLSSIALGHNDATYYNTFTILTGVFAFAFVFVGVLTEDMLQAFLLLVMAHGGVLIILVIWAYRKKYLPSFEFFKELEFKEYLKFSAMALAVLIFTRITDFYVRDFAIREYNLYETGLWQAVVKISNSYTTLFTSVAAVVFYPSMASLLHKKEELAGYLRKVLLILTPTLGGMLLGVYLFRFFLMTILFEAGFKDAAYLFPYQLTGDLFKLLSWMLAYLMMLEGKVVLFILSEAISAFLYIALVHMFNHEFKMEVFTFAHMIRSIIYFIFIFLVYRKFLFK
ncbi:MAG TPA: oligosaccharide flippase family protein [Cytophagaceae bacterium]